MWSLLRFLNILISRDMKYCFSFSKLHLSLIECATVNSNLQWTLTKGQEISGGQDRGQELTCYECASKTGNDTCTDAFRKTIKTFGFDKRCRIMEMNGKVVSQGVVPKAVCTPRALSNVRKIFQLLKKPQNKSSTLLIVCAQKN